MAALRLNGKWVEVADANEASAMVRKDIDSTGVGSEEWYSFGKTQGEVRESGKAVARISYNGRVWPTERRSSHGRQDHRIYASFEERREREATNAGDEGVCARCDEDADLEEDTRGRMVCSDCARAALCHEDEQDEVEPILPRSTADRQRRDR